MLEVSALNAEYHSAKGKSVRAAINIGFSVERGKFFTLLGPSGCGKTTTLRSIAGLEKPKTGEITVNGRVMFSAAKNIFVPLNKRNFGMVFQSYAIWPHMTVFQNAAFPLHVKHLPRAEIAKRVEQVLDAVALGDVAGRNATSLSGGQQQRLALARAIVMEPELLLLDEPLSNLDAKLRERMRFELKRIQRDLGITTLYVTHDQAEALAMSHQIAVMRAGRIVQIDSPRAIYEKPATRFVAEFIGSSNFIAAEVMGVGHGPDLWQVRSALGDWLAQSETPLVKGAKVTLSIRPENVELSEAPFADNGHANLSAGLVEGKIFQGDFIEFKIAAGGLTLLARAHPSLRTATESPIYFRVAPDKCATLSNDT